MPSLLNLFCKGLDSKKQALGKNLELQAISFYYLKPFCDGGFNYHLTSKIGLNSPCLSRIGKANSAHYKKL